MYTVILLISVLLSQPLLSASQDHTAEQSSPKLTRDMTEQEVEEEIRKAMPYPVISILSGVRDDRRHFAVNMRIAGKLDPVFHVSWNVPTSADRALMLTAIKAAREYAIKAAESLP